MASNITAVETPEQDEFLTYLLQEHEKKLRTVTLNDMSEIDITIDNILEVVEPEQGTRNSFNWTVRVSEENNIIERVTFKLHPTFTPQELSLVEPPFEIQRTGWGEFTIVIDVWIRGVVHELTHDLSLSETIATTTCLNIGDGEPVRRIKDLKPNLQPFEYHGRIYSTDDTEDWYDPIVVVECAQEARPGYHTMLAHEYEDDPRTLRKKVRLMADLIRQSSSMANGLMAYTGAGISTSSGIEDYASKAKNSYMKRGRAKARSGFEAEPTLGHRVLTAMHRAGFLKHWVQQNHDGLPQKAGYPQHEINEIHGAWFDVSNPVVPMSGTLRNDLCNWMYEWEKKCDLVLAMGTSLCGMNADRCVDTPEKKYLKNEGLGAIIIGLQRTPYDSNSTIRIFAKIDEVVALLADELNLTVPEYVSYAPNIPEEYIVGPEQYKIPYDRNGELTKDESEMIVWNLSEGQKLKVVSGPGEGFNGKLVGKFGVHYRFCTKNIREGDVNHGKGFVNFVIGAWWVETAVHGLWHQIPIVNLTPVMQSELEDLNTIDS